MFIQPPPEHPTDTESFKRSIAEQLVSRQLKRRLNEIILQEMKDAQDDDDEMQSIVLVLSVHLILKNVGLKVTNAINFPS